MAIISDKLNKILSAVFGKDVRRALHDGLDAINKETESTTARQNYLDRKYDEQIKNMTLQDPSSAEIVDMRVAANGKIFKKAGDRLNYFDEQLETKTKQLKNVDLYNNAIFDMQLIKELNYLSIALTNRKLRIAIVGDSITEGSNNHKNDTYVDILINKIKKILPDDIIFEHMNFALGGRGSANLVSEQVAHNPETPWSNNGYFVDFWREWSVEGKTWKEHIRDYKPDLIILAFGMNDSHIDNCGKALINNLQTFISYIKASNYYTDFVLVTTHLCSESLGIKNNNILCNNTVREFAYNNNYALLDAGRLSHILREGIDDCRYTTQEILDKTIISGLKCKNFEINFDMNTWESVGSENDIIFRDVMRFRFSQKNNEKHIYLFSEGNLLMDYAVTSNKINIKVFDSKISVNGHEIIVYDYIQSGVINIDRIINNITLTQFIQKIELSKFAMYDEKELLGDIPYNEGIGNTGNAINHPTALGHYLQYVASFPSLLNSITHSLNLKNSKYDFFENEWGYYGTNKSGLPILYNTNHGIRLVKKENMVKIYDYTKGIVFKRRTDLKISQVTELKENEFIVFNGNADTHENETNIFICKTYNSNENKQLYINVF